MITKATRDAIGHALVEIGEDPRVVVIDCDISTACKTVDFEKKFPERHLNVGIAEQNGAGVAAGLATCGKIPYLVTFAAFASMRMCEMIRQEICYTNLNVKIIGSHAGLTTASNGASHQSIEDYGIFRSIPNMRIVMPADYTSAIALMKEAHKYNGPVYLRFTRTEMRGIYEEGTTFEIGKGIQLKEGKDLSLIANGDMVSLALDAAEEFEKKGISCDVIDMHTIKPLDEELVKECIHRTGRLITLEDHNIIGGLGSAVSEVIAQEGKGILRRIGIKDEFGHCATYEQLLEMHGITIDEIMKKGMELCEKEV